MKFSITLIALIFIFSSCSHLPGHYLTKHDPGFYDKKDDTNISFLFEASGIKNGLQFSIDRAVLNQIFVGLSSHVYTKTGDLTKADQTTGGQSLYNMKGISFRPFIGYFKCFGKEKNLYWEAYAGGGYQYNTYNIYDPFDDILYDNYTNVFQTYAGAFFGWKFKTANIGFDCSYEYNWFHPKVMDYYYRGNGYQAEASFSPDFLSATRNISSSFFSAFKVKKIQIILNAGWNVGYTAIFVRTGLRYKF